MTGRLPRSRETEYSALKALKQQPEKAGAGKKHVGCLTKHRNMLIFVDVSTCRPKNSQHRVIKQYPMPEGVSFRQEQLGSSWKTGPKALW